MEIIQKIDIKSAEIRSKSVESAFEKELHDVEIYNEKWLKCRTCRGKIALISDRISVNHSESHIFKNPAGIFYRIVCFSHAPGLINITDYSEENSWFKGYLWSISLCMLCRSHMGWHYDSGFDKFFGLIVDRLTSG